MRWNEIFDADQLTLQAALWGDRVLQFDGVFFHYFGRFFYFLPIE